MGLIPRGSVALFLLHVVDTPQSLLRGSSLGDEEIIAMYVAAQNAERL